MEHKEYKALQIWIGDPLPPCMLCMDQSFKHCRDKNVECAAFRRYCDDGTFHMKDIAKRKGPFIMEDWYHTKYWRNK